MTLDVAISTFGAQGINSVASMRLPRVEGVRYVVSWQQHDNAQVPAALLRDDVTVVRTDTIGLSKNRNNSFRHCSADIVLIADDDLIYTAQNLRDVIATFQANDSLDLATFRYKGPEEAHPKAYPPTRHNLRKVYRHYYVTSFEIAIRLQSIRKHNLQFCELAGLGAPYLHAGEEGIFLHHCIRAGLNCEFFPITIVEHPELTTSTTRATDPGVIRAQGATMRILRGNITALTRIPITALRTPVNPLRAMLYLMQGYFYSLRHQL